MEQYFQFLAFSMEPHAEDEKQSFLLSPIYNDTGGLGEMITVVYPVFVSPTCSNGSAAMEKLLLGVFGKDVTLAELQRTYNLNKAQVANMVNENLGEARVCNENNGYVHCKMQVRMLLW